MGFDDLGDDAYELDFSLLRVDSVGRSLPARDFSHLEVRLGCDGIQILVCRLLDTSPLGETVRSVVARNLLVQALPLAIPVCFLGFLRKFHFAAAAELPIARIPFGSHDYRPSAASATSLVALVGGGFDVCFDGDYDGDYDGLLSLCFVMR